MLQSCTHQNWDSVALAVWQEMWMIVKRGGPWWWLSLGIDQVDGGMDGWTHTHTQKKLCSRTLPFNISSKGTATWVYSDIHSAASLWDT